MQRPKARRYAAKRLKEEHFLKRGKLLQHDKVTLEMHKLLDVRRSSEWNDFFMFEAVKVIRREDEEHRLKNRDAEVCPLNGWKSTRMNSKEQNKRTSSTLEIKTCSSRKCASLFYVVRQADGWCVEQTFETPHGNLEHGFFQRERNCVIQEVCCQTNG